MASAFDFFAYFDLPALYLSNPILWDALIYLMIFLGLSQFVFRKVYEGRQGKIIAIGVGLLLTFSMVLFEFYTGLYIGSYELALLPVMILHALIMYLFYRFLVDLFEMPHVCAVALSYLLTYGGLSGMFDSPYGRLGLYNELFEVFIILLNIIAVITVIVCITRLFSGANFGPGGDSHDHYRRPSARGSRRDSASSRRSGQRREHEDTSSVRPNDSSRLRVSLELPRQGQPYRLGEPIIVRGAVDPRSGSGRFQWLVKINGQNVSAKSVPDIALQIDPARNPRLGLVRGDSHELELVVIDQDSAVEPVVIKRTFSIGHSDAGGSSRVRGTARWLNDDGDMRHLAQATFQLMRFENGSGSLVGNRVHCRPVPNSSSVFFEFDGVPYGSYKVVGSCNGVVGRQVPDQAFSLDEGSPENDSVFVRFDPQGQSRGPAPRAASVNSRSPTPANPRQETMRTEGGAIIHPVRFTTFMYQAPNEGRVIVRGDDIETVPFLRDFSSQPSSYPVLEGTPVAAAVEQPPEGFENTFFLRGTSIKGNVQFPAGNECTTRPLTPGVYQLLAIQRNPGRRGEEYSSAIIFTVIPKSGSPTTKSPISKSKSAPRPSTGSTGVSSSRRSAAPNLTSSSSVTHIYTDGSRQLTSIGTYRFNPLLIFQERNPQSLNFELNSAENVFVDGCVVKLSINKVGGVMGGLVGEYPFTINSQQKATVSLDISRFENAGYAASFLIVFDAREIAHVDTMFFKILTEVEHTEDQRQEELLRQYLQDSKTLNPSEVFDKVRVIVPTRDGPSAAVPWNDMRSSGLAIAPISRSTSLKVYKEEASTHDNSLFNADHRAMLRVHQRSDSGRETSVGLATSSISKGHFFLDVTDDISTGGDYRIELIIRDGFDEVVTDDKYVYIDDGKR